MQRITQALILIITSITLISCISMRAPKAPDNYQTAKPQQRAKALTSINQWQINGAISVTESGHTDIAQYTWQQQPNHYIISFSGPLSIGQQRLVGTPDKVTLTNAKGQSFSAKSAEQLLVQQLGWHLPVAGLGYWIRNLPEPGTPSSTKYDQYGHLTELKQQGWQINYQRFVRVNQLDLPSVILINNPRVRVKIVIKQWQLQTA